MVNVIKKISSKGLADFSKDFSIDIDKSNSNNSTYNIKKIDTEEVSIDNDNNFSTKNIDNLKNDENKIQSVIDSKNKELDAMKSELQKYNWSGVGANPNIEKYNEYSSKVANLTYEIRQLKNEKGMLKYTYIKNTDDFKNYNVKSVDINKSDLDNFSKNNFYQLGVIDSEKATIDYEKYCWEGNINPFDVAKFIINNGDYKLSGSKAEELENLVKASEYCPELEKMYKYIYDTEGIWNANEYLDSIKDRVNQILGEAKANEFIKSISNDKDFANKVLNHVGVTGKGLDDGLKNYEAGMKAWFESSDISSIDEYEKMYLGEALKEKGYGLNINYNLSTSIGNMIPTLAISSIPGLEGFAATAISTTASASMGIAAGGDSYHSSLVKGYDKGTAAMYGIASGTSEALLEKLLGGLPGVGSNIKVGDAIASKFGILGNSVVRKGALNYLGEMGKEGLEEGIQEIVDQGLFRAGFLRENVDVSKMIKDAGVSAAYGAATAGILQSPGFALNVSRGITNNRGFDSGDLSGNGSNNNSNINLNNNLNNNSNNNSNSSISENKVLDNIKRINDSLTKKKYDSLDRAMQVEITKMNNNSFNLKDFMSKRDGDGGILLITDNQSVMTDNFTTKNEKFGGEHGWTVEAIYKAIYGNNADVTSGGVWQFNLLDKGDVCVQLCNDMESVVWIPLEISEDQYKMLEDFNDQVKELYKSNPKFFDENPMEFKSDSGVDTKNNIDLILKEAKERIVDKVPNNDETIVGKTINDINLNNKVKVEQEYAGNNADEKISNVIDILDSKYGAGRGVKVLEKYLETGDISYITRDNGARQSVMEISNQDIESYLSSNKNISNIDKAKNWVLEHKLNLEEYFNKSKDRRDVAVMAITEDTSIGVQDEGLHSSLAYGIFESIIGEDFYTEENYDLFDSGNFNKIANKSNSILFRMAEVNGTNYVVPYIPNNINSYQANELINFYDKIAKINETRADGDKIVLAGNFSDIEINDKYVNNIREEYADVIGNINNSQVEKNVNSLKKEILDKIDNQNWSQLEKARKLYIELGKTVNYDANYMYHNDIAKSSQSDVIYNKDINFDNLDSDGVICKGWSQLYKELLLDVGFREDQIIVRGGNGVGSHKWIEIKMDDGNIVIADATDAIKGELDLAKIKGGFSTNGFLYATEEYAGKRLSKLKEQGIDLEKIGYENLKSLDEKIGYNYDNILNEMGKKLFNNSKLFSKINDKNMVERILNMNMPQNMDGMEGYVYLRKISRNLFADSNYDCSTNYKMIRIGDKYQVLASINFDNKNDSSESYYMTFDKVNGKKVFDNFNDYIKYMDSLDIVG